MPGQPCPTCGDLPGSSYAQQKYDWPEDASDLPETVGRLEAVRQIDPPGSRTRPLRRCPACGAWFLDRLSEAAAYLEGPPEA